jgi:hypothetical protein
MYNGFCWWKYLKWPETTYETIWFDQITVWLCTSALSMLHGWLNQRTPGADTTNISHLQWSLRWFIWGPTNGYMSNFSLYR